MSGTSPTPPPPPPAAAATTEEDLARQVSDMTVTDNPAAPTETLEWPMNKVRQTFIDFFVKKHGHTYWPSSPCVPHDDPTLLFANAGMNQYKPLFLGTCDPNLEMSRLKRAVNTQKCIRAGGKHNDLDDVGKDVYHHTFFEMLGNWSFGDYFKEGAIHMAWTCLTEEFGLDPERIYASYFGGDKDSPADDEARIIWLKYLPAERVLPFGKEDNFWEMGATGPCGPCVEVHYDRIGNRDASQLVNADLPDVIEIWNNVFIQYNRESDGSLRPLPAQHIDTGMGFERLTSILQGVDSNYDTDIFRPIFDAITRITKCPQRYGGRVGTDDVGYRDMAYRVVADHVRTLCFSIADGATPSNDGRGYVLRRVLRRAVRYGRQNLGAELGFFHRLVPVVLEVMGPTFPELVARRDHITRVIREEEESFGKTLDKGLVQFDKLAAKTSAAGSTVFTGEDAHFLYTSLGFPVDLTELMAEEQGMTLDHTGFQAKMEEEKEKSKRKATGDSGKDMTLQAEQTFCLVGNKVEATADEAKYVWHEDLRDCRLRALFLGRNETEDNIGFVDSVSPDSGVVGLILDKTSFYAETGGQTYDTGILKSQTSDAVLQVENVQMYGGFALHLGKVVSGTFSVHDVVTSCVDYVRRKPIASNHTMTHVLNHALRDVLVLRSNKKEGGGGGSSVDQKGSLVDEHKLRYDFSWNGPLSAAELRAVERMCREQIRKAVPVHDMTAALDDARLINTLRAVFGENYPDPVRVVSISPVPIATMLSNPEDPALMDYSVEFCGGTHLTNTKEAEHFVLLSEEGIAKGIRRITCVTMRDAEQALARADDFRTKVDAAGTLEGTAMEAAVKLLNEEVKTISISTVTKSTLKDTLAKYSQAVVAWKKKYVLEQTQKAVEYVVSASSAEEGNKVVCRFDFGVDGKVAKSVMTAFGKKVKEKAFLLVSADTESGRFMVITYAPKGMKDMDCKAWITFATEGSGGKGGGKKDSAQFTVSGLDKIDGVLAKGKLF